jgi:hypothetical protein
VWVVGDCGRLFRSDKPKKKYFHSTFLERVANGTCPVLKKDYLKFKSRQADKQTNRQCFQIASTMEIR